MLRTIRIFLFLSSLLFSGALLAQPKFTIEKKNGNQGDKVCLKLKVTDFDSIIAFQLSFRWDPTILKYDTITYNSSIDGNVTFNTKASVVNQGIITCIWTAENPSCGTSVPNDTTFFELCFTIIGPPNSFSDVDISDNPLAIELYRADKDCGNQEVRVNPVINKGRVTVNGPPSSLELFGKTVTVPTGQIICVDVNVKNFVQMTKLQHSIHWDTAVIQFSGINNLNLANLTLPNFNLANILNGTLTLNWSAGVPSGVTIADSSAIYQLCFKAVGSPGTSSLITFDGNPLAVNAMSVPAGSANIGITTLANPKINVVSQNPLDIYASFDTVASGDRVCVTVSMKSFTLITKMQFSINWDPSLIAFDSVQVLGNIPGLSPSAFTANAGAGTLSVNWQSPGFPSGTTIPDSFPAFRICFLAVGRGGTFSNLVFTNNPQTIVVENELAPGTNINLNSRFGKVTIVSAPLRDMKLSLGNYFVDEQKTVCVDLFATNFREIESLQFTLEWDSSIVRLDSLTGIAIPGVTNSNYNINNTRGFMIFSWNATNPVTLGDSVLLGRLCFKAIGRPGDMTPLALVPVLEASKYISRPPLSDTSSTVNILQMDGKITINTVVNVVDTIYLKANCKAIGGGKVDITVLGGVLPYQFYWLNERGDTVSRQEDLVSGIGTYYVTITDSDVPPHTYAGVYVIQGDFTAPKAQADSAAIINCLSRSATLTSNGSSTGAKYVYEWFTSAGNIVTAPKSPSVIVSGGGKYTLIVTDTVNGCSAEDTSFVTVDTLSPKAIAGPDITINCFRPIDSLNGTLSAVDTNIIYQWTALSGSILKGDKSLRPTIGVPGSFELTVTNRTNGCFNKDTSVVTEDKVIPRANAGQGGTLNCTRKSIVLNGSGPAGNRYLFNWSSSAGGRIVNGSNSLSPTVDSGGIYTLIIRDTVNGCADTSRATVLQNTQSPIARAGKALTLNCLVTNTLLGDTTSSKGSNIVYAWFRNGTLIPSARNLQLNVNNPGTYRMVVTDTSNTCIAADSVVITKDTAQPNALITAPQQLTCSRTQVTIDATTSSKGSKYVYSWTTTGGNIVSGQQTLLAAVNRAGSYLLLIRDTTNNCIDSARITVTANQQLPTAKANRTGRIGCDTPELVLSGSGTSTGTKFQYSWTASQGGNIVKDSDKLNPTVNSAGKYLLVVRDTSNDCTSRDSVTITGNTDKPVALAENGTVTCRDSIININTAGSSSGVKFLFQWKTTNGNIVSGATSASARVNKGGDYWFVVRDSSNNCLDSIQIQVTENKTRPTVAAGPDLTINCQDSIALLNGASSSSGPSFTYLWTTLGGNFLGATDDLIARANAPGRYILTISNKNNGCVATDTMFVIRSATKPVVVINKPGDIKCPNTNITLDASASTPATNVIFQWTTSNGTIVSGATTNRLTVSKGGIYVLRITNTTNLCQETGSVTVNQLPFPPDANAGEDQVVCFDSVLISGNLPTGGSGTWKTLGGQLLTGSASAVIRSLRAGNNYFVWTLSTADCPNYDADTINVIFPRKPTAINDLFSKPFDQDSIDLNVIANDNPGALWNLNLLTTPKIGKLTNNGGGQFKYSAPKSFFGNTFFNYALCNTQCPNLCDTAEVKINVKADPNGIDSYLPNAITPNGDGKNDVLIFDILAERPEDYPNNELVIFNRWGDVVFKAKPYLNDWKGTNNSDQSLPEGTYYYILRLNVPDGTILRGDITILK